MTDETNKIWHDGYERYLKEWEGGIVGSKN